MKKKSYTQKRSQSKPETFTDSSFINRNPGIYCFSSLVAWSLKTNAHTSLVTPYKTLHIFLAYTDNKHPTLNPSRPSIPSRDKLICYAVYYFLWSLLQFRSLVWHCNPPLISLLVRFTWIHRFSFRSPLHTGSSLSLNTPYSTHSLLHAHDSTFTRSFASLPAVVVFSFAQPSPLSASHPPFLFFFTASHT